MGDSTLFTILPVQKDSLNSSSFARTFSSFKPPNEKADLMRSPHQQLESTRTTTSFFSTVWKKFIQPSWRIKLPPACFMSSGLRPLSKPDSITLKFAFFSKSESCSSASSRPSKSNFSAAKVANMFSIHWS
nr:hypothetical protein Iba_scaffold41447CG0010 [Ipomoea batatas]